MNKLTPSDLSVEISGIEVADENYDLKEQVRFSSITPMMGVTYNGTQTFGTKGEPKDKDNDKD